MRCHRDEGFRIETSSLGRTRGRSRVRRGWRKENLGRNVRDREGSMEAARTGRSNFTTASGSRASSGSFPLARTISRVGAHCVSRAREWSVHPPRTRENLHRFLGPLCRKFSRQFSGTRHSSSSGAQGSGRHWTRARHGRWTTWTGSRILPRNPMSPRISAICTRTSEVRFARETAAVLGQRPASACAFLNGESASRRGGRETRALAETPPRVARLPSQNLDETDIVFPRGRANR